MQAYGQGEQYIYTHGGLKVSKQEVRQIVRQVCMQACKDADKQAGMQAGRQAGKQGDSSTNTQVRRHEI